MPLGSNVTIDTLHRVLDDIYATDEDLPDILFLQLDNTTRQCKAQYVMAWCAYLVHMGTFKEVYISFLPKGHTHEDIDQFFSRIAAYLAKHDCPSPLAFVDCVEKSFTFAGKSPKVEELSHVANISEWMAKYIAKLPKITDWHQFHFRLKGVGENREVRLRVREWIATEGPSSDWVGLAPHELDSAVFASTPETTAFLKARPFSSGPVPPTLRKAKRSKAKESDKEERDPRARLYNDIEKLIELRKVGERDAKSLRDAVTLLNADDDEHPLEFDWNTSVYEEMYDRMCDEHHMERKEALDRELEEVLVHHAIGTEWAVRSDFASQVGWEKKTMEDLELWWVVRVVGAAFRREDGKIRIPVRYYESTEKKKTRSGTMQRRYQLGDLTADLTTQDLQYMLTLTAPVRGQDKGFKFIKAHHMKRLDHVATRWWENAHGKYDVRADKADSSDEDEE